MKSRNQDGFSALETILVVVAVVLIGAAVYYGVWGHKTKAVAITTPTPTANVLTYTSWSSLPYDTQQAVVTVANMTNPGFVTADGNCTTQGGTTFAVVQTQSPLYIEKDSKYVAFTIGCGETPEHVLAANINGTWKVVYSGEGSNLPVCGTLTQYKVPLDLLNKSNTFVQTSRTVYQCAPSSSSVSAQTYNGPANG